MSLKRDLKARLKPHLRSVWFPLCEAGPYDDDVVGSPSSSKFSGIPFIPQSEEWPLCGNCGKEMQLLLQLNSEELPREAACCFGTGLLQVFYCTDREDRCEVEFGLFSPFSKTTLVRVIDPRNSTPIDYASSPVNDAFPENLITDWDHEREYPCVEELEGLGVSLTDEEVDALDDSDQTPAICDKLLGWPWWVQGVSYPNCAQLLEFANAMQR